MFSDVFNIALSNGIFASLFVALLVYVLKDSRKRESKYQNIIDNLSTHLSTVDEIKQDVAHIKKQISSNVFKLKKEKKAKND